MKDGPIVFSIPHSGTRTLMEILGIKEKNWYHFVVQQEYIDQYKGEVNIPLRNLYDVTKSWQTRYGNGNEINFSPANLEKMNHALIKYWKRHNPSIFVIEQYKVKKGARTPISDEEFRKSPRFHHLKNWYTKDIEVQSFYRRFFGRDVVMDKINNN